MNKQQYDDIIQYLTNFSYPTDYDASQRKQIQRLSTHYIVKNSQLYKSTKEGLKRVITHEQVEILLFNLHKNMTGAHLRIEAVYNKAKDRYYWPQMFENIREYIKNCDNCQRRGPITRKEPLQPILVKAPFHRVGLDIKGPLPITKTGNRYIIVAMDYFTKWPEARAIKDIKADTVAKFLYEDVICRHGAPEEILTDRGASFMNQVVDQLCQKFQTKHRLTSPYRSQTNGMVERFNCTIGECLAKLVYDQENEWDNYVSSILFAYRTMKHKSTNYTPFYLMYGQQAVLPVDLQLNTISTNEENIDDALLNRLTILIDKLDANNQDALDNMNQTQERQKDRHNDHRVSERLKIGEKVLVEKTWKRRDMSAKLEAQW